MSVKFIYSKPGYKYIPTELGLEISKVSSKYGPNSTHQYDVCVPENWVKNAWVKEIKRG